MASATNILLAALEGNKATIVSKPVKTYENGKILIGDQAQRWKKVKEVIGVSNNRDVAEYLLNLYEKYVGELVIENKPDTNVSDDSVKDECNKITLKSDESTLLEGDNEPILEKVVPEIIEVSPAIFDFDFESSNGDPEDEDEVTSNGYGSENGDQIEHPDFFTSTVQEKIKVFPDDQLSHETEAPYVRCKLCSRLIQTKSFQHHMSNKHGGPIQCSICHITFKNNNSLRSHKHQIHSGPVRCEYCGVVKKNRGAYREHKAHYHEPRTKNSRKVPIPLLIQCRESKKLKSQKGASKNENNTHEYIQSS